MSKLSPLPFTIPTRWRFPVILGVIVLLLFGASFVNDRFLSGDSANNPLNTQQAQDIIKECTYDAEICNYIAAQTVAFQSGVTIESNFQDEVSSDNFRSVIQLDGNSNTSIMSYQDSELIAHLITLDGTIYMLDLESSSWYELGTEEENAAQINTSTPLEFVEELMSDENMITMEFLGDEACGSSQCKKYQIFSDDLILDGVETEVFIWIDPSNSLMQRMLVQEGSSQITMDYVYGSVTISKPDNVISFQDTFPMEANPQEMVNQFEGTDGAEPTQEEIEQYIRELGF